jgi:sugar/nucleoside kinase (ribokinase family)
MGHIDVLTNVEPVLSDFLNERYTLSVVDTLDAGDAFIRHVLAGLLEDDDRQVILARAADCATDSVVLRGVFGYSASPLALVDEGWGSAP